MLIREKLGGSLPVQLLVHGDLLDPATLTAMRSLERHLDALPLVSKSQSLAGIIAELNAAMNGRYAIPETREEVANLWFLIEEEDEIGQIVADGATREGLLQARVADWETDAIIQAVAGVDAWRAGRSDRMVVADRRKVDGVPRASLEVHRVRDLVTALEAELAGRGARADASLEAIATGFLEWSPDATGRAAIRGAVGQYLAGPEAEVPVAEGAAARLARFVADSSEEWGIASGFLDGVIREAAPDADARDREDLALSLARVDGDALGRVRVARAMAALTETVPQLVRDSVLRRNVSGALWEALGPFVAMDAAVATQVGLDDADVVRATNVSISRSGLASVMKQMEEELLPTQLESVLLTLGVVVVLLSLMFRSPTAGVMMAIPLGATIMLNLGVMGYLSIGLDSFTAMVGSIAIGLGVDYAIHFTHRFRRELAAARGKVVTALTATVQTSGVAIVVNTLSVGLGFLTLLAAGGQHIRRFGGLTSLAMLSAGLFTLVLLPAVYLTFRPRFLGMAGSASAPARAVTDGALASDTRV